MNVNHYFRDLLESEVIQVSKGVQLVSDSTTTTTLKLDQVVPV